jgi:predicted neutral ceramidase superfamily lipid hydrolase
VLLGIWAVFSALVLISRMYLGAHSLDQIIFGGLLGFAFLIIYKYQFQKMMYSAVTNILSLKNKKLYLIINTLLFVMFLVLPIVEYLINSSNRPVDIADLNNINSKCSKDLTSDSLQ